MTIFDISDNEMINLEQIAYVKFDRMGKDKVVIAGVGNGSFIVPVAKHKEFFTQLMRLGATPNKQFVSL